MVLKIVYETFGVMKTHLFTSDFDVIFSNLCFRLKVFNNLRNVCQRETQFINTCPIFQSYFIQYLAVDVEEKIWSFLTFELLTQ